MEKSGGQLVEQTTHIVDLLRYLGGEVTSVHAFMNLSQRRELRTLIYTTSAASRLRLRAVRSGMCRTTFLQPDHRSGLEMMGGGFRLIVDGGTLTIVEPEQTIIKKSNGDFYQQQDLAFLRAVEIGNQSLILATYEEALENLTVTLAANQSARTGKVVRV